MIRVRIKIGSGSIVDTQTYGLVYLDSDKRVGPDVRDFERTAYPEEEGEHILPKTTDAPFDYTAKFFIQATSLKDANKLIGEFNALLFTQESGSDTKEFKKITFFNDYKRHKIVGYPSPMAEAQDFWRDPQNQVNDVVIVELHIRVVKPSECEWKVPFTEDQPSNQQT